jgi:hypothetical protein
MSIPFTQYLRPKGKRKRVVIDRPDEIEDMANELYDLGFHFEVEILQTGQVSMSVFDTHEGVNVASVICENGPEVGESVDKLVRRAHAAVIV